MVNRVVGTGAIDFIMQYAEGKSQEEFLAIYREIENGELIDLEDKRIKRCDYCGYYWRDPSLRNTRKTCSEECKRGIKTIQRRAQRAKKAIENPKPRKKKLIDDYINIGEYPFWVDEYSMAKVTWKHEKSLDADAMDAIQFNIDYYGEGNRKVNRDNYDYDGYNDAGAGWYYDYN